jgi:MFS family permease
MLATTERHFWIAIVARALLGFTIGAFSAVIPMYMVELAPEHARAFHGSFHQIGVASGFAVLYLTSTRFRWRAVTLGGAILPGVMSLLIWFVPEPARYADEEEEPMTTESPFQMKWAPRLNLCALLAFFQQLSGIHTILVDLHSHLHEAKIDLEMGYASAIAMGAEAFASLIAGCVLDCFGHRFVWVFSFGLVALTDLAYGVTELEVVKSNLTIPPLVPVIIIGLHLFAFGAGAGPIPWFIASEIFPDSVRAGAVSLIASCNRIFAFLVVLLFPEMRKYIELSGLFILYGVVSVASAVYGFFYLKKGRYVQEEEDEEDEE